MRNKSEKFIEYGLYLFAFILPLQTRWIFFSGGNEFWTYSLYLTDVLLIIILLAFSLSSLFRRPKGGEICNEFVTENTMQFQKGRYYRFLASLCSARNNKKRFFLYSILLLDFACIVSIFFAIDRWLAIYKFAWLLLGECLAWILISVNYNKVKLIWSMLFGIFLQAGLGIYQFLFQTSFASKWLGMALHNPGELGTSVIETVGVGGIGERWLRAYGGLDHPNMLGGVLSIGLLLIIYLILKSKAQNLNFKSSPKSKKLINFVLLSFYFIFIIGLVFTFSRGAWVAFAAGAIFLLLAYVIKKDLKAQKEILIYILFSGILFFIIFNLFNNLFITRISASGRLEGKSKNERVSYLIEAKNIILKNYLPGVGIGNYEKVLERKDPGQSAYEYQPVHNVFMLVWAETGVLGILGFLGLLGVLGWSLFKLGDIPGLAILFSLTIVMFFDHWLWTLHFGVLFFWFMIGLLKSQRENI